MRRFGMVLVVGALLLALTAGVAFAELESGAFGKDNLRGTTGDDVGQDTLISFGDDDIIRSGASPVTALSTVAWATTSSSRGPASTSSLPRTENGTL